MECSHFVNTDETHSLTKQTTRQPPSNTWSVLDLYVHLCVCVPWSVSLYVSLFSGRPVCSLISLFVPLSVLSFGLSLCLSCPLVICPFVCPVLWFVPSSIYLLCVSSSLCLCARPCLFLRPSSLPSVRLSVTVRPTAGQVKKSSRCISTCAISSWPIFRHTDISKGPCDKDCPLYQEQFTYVISKYSSVLTCGRLSVCPSACLFLSFCQTAK